MGSPYPQFKSPLIWSSLNFHLLLYVPVILTLLLMFFSWFSQNRYQNFVALRVARVAEIKVAKLAGVGAYYWKPLLNCGGIHHDLGSVAHCLPLKFSLLVDSSSLSKSNHFRIVEPLTGPCVLCHQGTAVVYEFFEPAPLKLSWQASLSLAIALAALWYLVWLWFAWKRKVLGKQPLVVLSMVSGNPNNLNWQVMLNKLPSLYCECKDNSLQSVMTIPQFQHWLNSWLTGGSSTNSTLKMAACLAPPPRELPLPLASLRRAYLMAQHGIAGSLLVEKQLLDTTAPSGITPSHRKAFWKSKQGELTEFSILKMSQESIS